MEKKIDWDSLLTFYKEKLNVPEYIVFLLSDYNILTMCCTGFSNELISEFLDVDESSVKGVLVEHFDFNGWKLNLDKNPLLVYNNTITEIEDNFSTEFMDKFYSNLKENNFSGDELEIAYNICNILARIERNINEYYS